MATTASQLFEFFDQNQTCSVERNEVSSAVFSALRRSVRAIVVRLREEDDETGREISDTLRMHLSEWLTTPVPFDDTILQKTRCFDNPAAVELRWGRDIRAHYDGALTAAQELTRYENPVREQVLATIRQLHEQKRSFRIYCHRRARPCFESILANAGDPPLADTTFLHSVKHYRETEPFYALIKVGPLRSRGWGSAPDALLTAPRFSHLIQIVWSGCGDEPDFGYDPVCAPSAPQGPGKGVTTTPTSQTPGGASPVSWMKNVTHSSDGTTPAGDYEPDSDEFQIFREMNQPEGNRPAILVQIDEEQGILYPPHAKVLSFDPAPSAHEPLSYRLPGETLATGMFIIRALLHGVDLGGLQAEHGHYSRIWKERLRQERQKDQPGLIGRLFSHGLVLGYLRNAIAHWCEEPTTVIHAPQLARHFEILIRVLGIEFTGTDALRPARRPWWQYAWDEIRRSRGEAIAAGFHEQDLIDEQLLAILKNLLADIRRLAAEAEGFALPIPPGQTLQGAALFNKVLSVEEGFHAPQTEIRVVRDLNTFEQWRV